MNQCDTNFTWPELVWSALMVGKSSFKGLVNCQQQSGGVFDLKARAYILRSLLEKQDNGFSQTQTYQNMEKSEKGFGSFWLGMIMAKAKAQKDDQTPFLMHVSALSSTLENKIFQAHSNKNGSNHSGKRPDLIGLTDNHQQILVVEAKGSANSKNGTLAKATAQLQTVILPTAKLKVCQSYFSSVKKVKTLSVNYQDVPQINQAPISDLDAIQKELITSHFKPFEGVSLVDLFLLRLIGITIDFHDEIKKYLIGINGYTQDDLKFIDWPFWFEKWPYYGHLDEKKTSEYINKFNKEKYQFINDWNDFLKNRKKSDKESPKKEEKSTEESSVNKKEEYRKALCFHFLSNEKPHDDSNELKPYDLNKTKPRDLNESDDAPQQQTFKDGITIKLDSTVWPVN